MSELEADLVQISRIGKAHGLRGEVTVELFTSDPQGRLAPGATLVTEATPGSGVPKTLTVASARDHNGTWLIGFDGIPDRTGAEGLRGTRLRAPRAVPADDEADGYYESDLVGLAVRDPAGESLGEVIALVTGTAQDRLVLRLLDGVEVEVPFVEAIVPIVEVAGGYVVVDAPAGLFDLARRAPARPYRA